MITEEEQKQFDELVLMVGLDDFVREYLKQKTLGTDIDFKLSLTIPTPALDYLGVRDLATLKLLAREDKGNKDVFVNKDMLTQLIRAATSGYRSAFTDKCIHCDTKQTDYEGGPHKETCLIFIARSIEKELTQYDT